jgi:FecR protein
MDGGNNQTENKPLAGGDDYLWDGSGESNPEIQRLEALLGRFRYELSAPVFPAIAPGRRWIFMPGRMRRAPVLATTAVAAVVIALVTFLVYGNKTIPVNLAGWNVSRVTGTPRIGINAIGAEETSRLGIGEVLETDHQSRANLRAEEIGQIEVEANTRLRVLTMGAGLKRIALDHGTIHAYIWAVPGQFVVDTPSAVTVDLGCAYTLQVDDSGAGLVRTSLGWVGFKSNGHESFIPAGAACATKPKVGPGTPYFENASSKFRSALARFDFEDNTPRQCAEDLAVVLDESRKRDALTLWHLLTRVEEGKRILVYDRLAKLAPPPSGTTKGGIMRLDQPMLDLWWNELGFDDILVWRHWERSWAAAPTPVREK